MHAQDVSGGSPVMVAGTDVPLWGMEIDPDESTKRFRASSAADKGQVRHVAKALTYPFGP